MMLVIFPLSPSHATIVSRLTHLCLKCIPWLFALFCQSFLALPLTIAQPVLNEPSLKIRPRYEYVKDFVEETKNAQALTTRLDLSVGLDNVLVTPKVSGFIRFINVSSLIRQYNSTSSSGNNFQEYSAVADPPLTRLSEGYLKYDMPLGHMIVGRKVLAFDDERFVGAVDWRQMPQSFGVFELMLKPTQRFHVQFDYVYERLGIKDELNKRYKEGNYLINAGLDFDETFKPQFNVFAYLLENLHNTYGARLSVGDRHGLPASIYCTLTYAIQKSPTVRTNGVAVDNIDNDFIDVMILTSINNWGLGFNEILLSHPKGSNGQGFATPWATLHKFEGFADVYLSQVSQGSADGLGAHKLLLRIPLAELGTLQLDSYSFYKAKNGQNAGDEIDALIGKKLSDDTSVLVKAALFKHNDLEVNKYWVMMTYKI